MQQRSSLDDFIREAMESGPAGATASHGSARLPGQLQYVEADLPPGVPERILSHLSAKDPGGEDFPYLAGLCLLASNRQAESLPLLERAILAWPAAANPRAAYVTAAFEVAPLPDSRLAMLRAFHLRHLIVGLGQHDEATALSLLSRSADAIMSDERFTGLRLAEEAEEVPGQRTYLSEMLFVKCYASSGRSEASMEALERHREPLLAMYPRVGSIGKRYNLLVDQ